jgi:hypothetical protein
MVLAGPVPYVGSLGNWIGIYAISAHLRGFSAGPLADSEGVDVVVAKPTPNQAPENEGKWD